MRFLTPFLLLVVLLSGAAQAQETTAAWEVTVYIPDESAIVTLSAAGEIERLPVPEQVTEILKHTFDPVIRLSADHHWLAFNQEIDSGVVYLSDLQAGSCCVEFGAETALPDGTMPGVFQLVGFSPDGTKLALVAEHYPMECGEYCFPDTSGILVELDTMTLQVVGDFVSSGSRPVGWVDGGIASTQVVYCLPGEMCVRSTVVSVQVVRDVKAGEIVSSIPIGVSNYAYDRGDHLYSSGEYITPYVYVPSEPGNEGIEYAAVIYYAPEMDAITWRSAPAILYIPEEIDYNTFVEYQIVFARWVLDGQGVLIRTRANWDQVTLLLRDGTQTTFDSPFYHQFLSGTPDGWLMVEWDDGGGDPTPESLSIFHYRYADGELTVSEVGAYTSTPIFLGATPLGNGITEPFPTVEPLKFIG